MRKLYILLIASFSTFIGFSFADSSIASPSYSIKGDDIKIYRTDNSKGGYMDINLQDPKTNERLHFGEVKMSDQVFAYTRQWDGDQNVRIIPGDGGDQIKFTIKSDKESTATTKDSISNNNTNIEGKTVTNRTVIQAVPKTGPSGSLIGIILATLAIFGGYIYIKKRADI